MKVPSTLDDKNLAACHAHKHRLASPDDTNPWWAKLCVIGLFCGPALAIIAHLSQKPSKAMSIVACLATTSAIVWVLARMAEKKKNDQMIADSVGNIEFDDVGVELMYDTGVQYRVEWPGVESWFRNEAIVLIRHPSGWVILIPVPADPTTASDMMQLLERNIPIPPR